jgi:hypothetical protein
MWEKIQRTKKELLNKIKEQETFNVLDFASLLGFEQDGNPVITKISEVFVGKIESIKTAKGFSSDKEAFEYIVENENGWLQPIIEWLAQFKILSDFVKKWSVIVQVSEFISAKEREEVESLVKATEQELLAQLDMFQGISQDQAGFAQNAHGAPKTGIIGDDPQQWYVKKVLEKDFIYGLITGVKNEGVREVIGATFMQKIGLAAPQVKVITEGETVTGVASKKVGDIDAKSVRTLGQFFEEQGLETQEARKQFLDANPGLKQEIMALCAANVLIGNRDGHINNVMIIEGQDGKLSAAAIDFGLSCHKINNFAIMSSGSTFDLGTMLHKSLNGLFDQDEYKAVMREEISKFNENKNEITKQLKVQGLALKQYGFSKHQFKTLISNIDANVQKASMFAGVQSLGI